jgi:hypothetical protein
VGAAVFGLGDTFWRHAVQVEVYALHVFLAALALLGALRYRRTGQLSALALAALAGSLGLAHHLTIVLLAPAVLLLCGRRLWCDSARGRRLAVVGALLPLGPALYLLLLVWARAEPLHAWGHPVTLPLLWDHASARIYRHLLMLPDGARLWEGLVRGWGFFTQDFAFGFFLLPVLGVFLAWKRDRGAAAGLLVAAVVVIGYNLCYTIEDITGYYLAAWAPAAAFLSVTLDAAWRRVRCVRVAPFIATASVLLWVGSLLLRNGSACDLSRAVWVREFARHKLESTDAGAVLITSADIDTFPIWYVQDVLGVRRDVVTLERELLRANWISLFRRDDRSQWYLHHLRAKGLTSPSDVPVSLETLVRLANDGALIGLLDHQLRGRPLFSTFGPPAPRDDQDPWIFLHWATARYEVSPQGLVLRWQPKNDPEKPADVLARNEEVWSQIDLPEGGEIRRRQDGDLTIIADHYARMLGVLGDFARASGDTARAEVLYRRALECAPDFQEAAAALASLSRAALEKPLERRHAGSSDR